MGKSQFINGMLRYFGMHKPLITADFFEKKSEKAVKKGRENFSSARENFEKMISKIMKKESNRVISFLKVQDKFLSEMKEEICYKLSSEISEEYHPLFKHTDYILFEIENYLASKGENFESIFEFIRAKKGEQYAENFRRSFRNVQEKVLKY